MKTDRNILRKCATMLALIVSTTVFEACAKEPSPLERSGITMTTKASKVNFGVAGTGDIVIDWGDGTKSNLNDATTFDEVTKVFWPIHDYSGTTVHKITITGNITKLYCNGNDLTALDVSGSPGLTVLDCGFNQLTGLDVSGNPGLTELICDFNQLTGLDVSKNTALIDFMISNNQLTGLDVSKNTALTRLDCRNNRLKSLNFSTANIAMVVLNCSYNQLTASALNDVFRALPEVKGSEYSAGGGIIMVGNPGEFDCERSIAQKKGWEISIR